MALFEPDRYAWELFKAISHPAALWAKCPDPQKRFGADGPVVWETWRNIAPEAPRSVFPPKGANPGPWRTYQPSNMEIASIAGLTMPGTRALNDLVVSTTDRTRLRTSFDMMKLRSSERFLIADTANTDRSGTEIRLNRDAYLFIRQNQLYNRDVLTAMAKSGKVKTIHLPPAAKEIKARWQEITEDEKPRYHWVTFENTDGSSQTWGLTALHITTKDLPNWFWTTFEHVDTSENWENPTIDAYSCPQNPMNCEAVPPEIRGTKWENYRMRGTQVSFVDSRGDPVRLASSQIEEGVQDTSSCMTCHAEAAMQADGEHVVPNIAYLGVPKKEGLEGTMQLDFMFAFERASSPSDK